MVAVMPAAGLMISIGKTIPLINQMCRLVTRYGVMKHRLGNYGNIYYLP